MLLVNVFFYLSLIERTENRSDSQVMQCSIQLSKSHFKHQDQFAVKKSVNTDQLQVNQKDFNHHDRCSIRIQPKRAVKSLDHRESNIAVAKISAGCASTGKNSISKQQSKVLCKKSRSSKNVLIEVGQVVLAKQKFSVPWPSKIMSIKKDSVHVYFFGDGRCGPVKKCDLFSICDSKDIMINCIKRKITNYRKGIIEMESLLGVPDNLSLTNVC